MPVAADRRRVIVAASAVRQRAVILRARQHRPPGSGGPYGRRTFQAELLHRGFAHLDLAHLPGDRHRVTVDELPVTRDLEGRDLTAAELGQLLPGHLRALLQLDQAMTSSPYFSEGTPMTWTSEMAGWL